ncbi:MAG: hypothetical protein L0Z54_05050 [Thermoplasmata archaeon]|nr:hypothetical protein [Thermoplasmata archaeon]
MHASHELERVLRGHRRLVLSYSGGVDSAFLLRESVRVLGARYVRAVMVVNEAVPGVQRRAALANAEVAGAGVEYVEVPFSRMGGFDRNPPDRCALCKRTMYAALAERTAELAVRGEGGGRWTVADGATTTDFEKGRIGLGVAAEFGVAHPLAEAGLSDLDVRRLAADLGLPFASMPSTTCLATRFPEGEPLTIERLKAVERAEEAIMEMGFPLVRVRLWGGPALVQVSPDLVGRLAGQEDMRRLAAILSAEGIGEFEVDPAGYRES